MNILGIETSCDETAVSVVQDGRKILSNAVVSQIDIFAEYGGVIPEVAARSHLEAMLPVLHKALHDANLDWPDIDAIAVTHTPGLLGSLLVGTLTARTLAILHEKPLYAVHHLKSHIYANWLVPELLDPSEGQKTPILTGSTPTFPLLALVISGGHTQIIHMNQHNYFEIIGTTHDDAIGECFDKVAKILGLPYPGGPAISKLALSGDRQKYHFPHPKMPHPLDFSFSGLKTAVLRQCQSIANVDIKYPSHDIKNLLTPEQKADVAASFEQTAVDILLEKLSLSLGKYPVKSIVIAGGVSANSLLRRTLSNENISPDEYSFQNTPVFFPEPKLSGDNGAMVASAAFYEIQSGVQPTDPYKLNIYPRSAIR